MNLKHYIKTLQELRTEDVRKKITLHNSNCRKLLRDIRELQQIIITDTSVEGVFIELEDLENKLLGIFTESSYRQGFIDGMRVYKLLKKLI